MKKFN